MTCWNGLKCVAMIRGAGPFIESGIASSLYDSPTPILPTSLQEPDRRIEWVAVVSHLAGYPSQWRKRSCYGTDSRHIHDLRVNNTKRSTSPVGEWEVGKHARTLNLPHPS